MFRFPGGSSSDDFHFNAGPDLQRRGDRWQHGELHRSVNGVGLATIDYGSGSPQEAAAFLAYLEAPVGNTTSDRQRARSGATATNSWQTVNWQTAGYWASLRASAPLADRRRPQLPAARSPGAIQRPVLGGRQRGVRELGDRPPYRAARPGDLHRVCQAVRSSYAATIDPSISIGLDVGQPRQRLQQLDCRHPPAVGRAGRTIGFLSDHNYVQAPGSESDSNLLLDTTTGTEQRSLRPGRSL